MSGFALKVNAIVKSTEQQSKTIAKLKKIEEELYNVRNILNVQTKLRIQLGEEIRASIQEISDCRVGVLNMKEALNAVVDSVKGTEQRVIGSMPSNKQLASDAKQGTGNKKGYNISGMHVNSSDEAYWQNNDEYAYIKGEISGSVGMLEFSGADGLFDYSASGEFLTGSLKGEGKAALFQDGEFDPELALYLGVSGSILTGEAAVKYGTDDINVYGNAEFAVGHGEATLDASAGKIQNGDGSASYGAKVSVGAEVCAVQGEVEGGFELFGIKFGASAKGKAGALSAKADASATTEGISCSASLAFLFGGEVSLAVDWSEFEFPEINWKDIELPKDWWPF